MQNWSLSSNTRQSVWLQSVGTLRRLLQRGVRQARASWHQSICRQMLTITSHSSRNVTSTFGAPSAISSWMRVMWQALHTRIAYNGWIGHASLGLLVRLSWYLLPSHRESNQPHLSRRPAKGGTT